MPVARANHVRLRGICVGWVRILSMLASFAVSASAKLPELDAVFWGSVSHRTNQALIPVSTGQIIIMARLNGVNISTSILPFGSNSYVLKVPMDDGVDPRLPGTARFGERIHVFVRNTVSGTEFETTQSSSLGLSLPNSKGVITSLNLAVTGDLGATTPSIASYALWAANYPPLAASLAAATDPAAGRGLTNYQAFIAGLDPTNPGDNFSIQEIKHLSGLNSLRFGPTRLSRLYSIYYSSDLVNWTKVTDLVPTVAEGSHWYDHVTSNAPQLFYRVEVNIQ